MTKSSKTKAIDARRNRARTARRACWGKVKYWTANAAASASKRLHDATGESTDWYFCQQCNYWHVTGHPIEEGS